VVVLVSVDRGQMLPLTQDFVRALPAVVSHMGMLVLMDNSLVRVLVELGDMNALGDLGND